MIDDACLYCISNISYDITSADKQIILDDLITNEGIESSLSNDHNKNDNKDFICHVAKGMCVALSSCSITDDDNDTHVDGSIIIDARCPF